MTKSHRYRIQTVSELTGVATSTLRAWERRYGVPSPDRTDSSYRMYGETDIAVIRRMRELINSGVSASEAARLARAPMEEEPPPEPDRFSPVVRRLVELTREMNAPELQRAVRGSLALGDAFTVVGSVLAPALREVGDEWHAGRISVAHEHLASEIIGGVVRDLLRHVQPVYPRARAVLGCFSDELHTLPLYAAAFGFAQCGVATNLLGARTDPDALAAAIHHLMPQIIGLSVTLPPNPSSLEPMLDGYEKAAGMIPWMVGGSGVTAIRDAVEERGAVVVDPQADSLRSTIEELLVRVSRRPPRGE